MSASNKKKLRKEQNAALLTEKQQQEKAAAQKLKKYTISFIAIITAVVLVAVLTAGFNAYKKSGIPQRNTKALVVGEHTLTNVDLNYFYINNISEDYNELYNQYGEYVRYYAAMLMNLDITKPLNAQTYSGDMTYADYYTEAAISDAISAYTFYDLAVAAGHKLTEDEQTELDSTYGIMEIYVEYGGYKNMTEYLVDLYGPGSDEESFRRFNEVKALAESYQQHYYDNLSYEQSEKDAYEETHADTFSNFTYSTFPVKIDDFIAHEGDDHAHTDEEHAAALKAAEEAAKTIVANGGSNNKTLLKAVNDIPAYKESTLNNFSSQAFSNIPTVFAEWLTDASRKIGDIGMLPYETTSTAEDGTQTKTQVGYYVIILEGKEENNSNLVTVRHILSAFEGGTTDSSTGKTVYSEAEKKAALEAIEAVKKQFEEGAKQDEDSFIALVKDNSDDTGSVNNGGLIDNIYPGATVTNFNNWCFDESRSEGDYEIVETEYGYHLIYFVRQEETTYRDLMVENAMRAEDFDAWYKATIEAQTHTVLNTSWLDLDMIIGA